MILGEPRCVARTAPARPIWGPFPSGLQSLFACQPSFPVSCPPKLQAHAFHRGFLLWERGPLDAGQPGPSLLRFFSFANFPFTFW